MIGDGDGLLVSEMNSVQKPKPMQSPTDYFIAWFGFPNLNIKFLNHQEGNSVKRVPAMAGTSAIIANAIRTTMEVDANTWMNAAPIKIAELKENVST